MLTVQDRLANWWVVLRIALEERFVYRGDFALGTLMRFLPIITQIFLWWAVFKSIGGGDVQQADVAGYSYQNMVAYYLMTMIGRAFSSMPGLASGIANQIRNGEIKKFIIQPIDMIGFLLLTRVAHKLAYYAVAIGPFVLVFYFCRWFFEGWPDALTLLAFFASLIMGFLLGYFLEASIGLMGFWFLEVNSLLFVYMLFSFFLSGHMFPLDMLPAPWSTIVDLMPLKYLAYFPAAIFLKKVEGLDLLRGLCIEAGWIVFFIWLCRFMHWRGLKRYSAYGG